LREDLIELLTESRIKHPSSAEFGGKAERISKDGWGDGKTRETRWGDGENRGNRETVRMMGRKGDRGTIKDDGENRR
jgi:hypothetical protein